MEKVLRTVLLRRRITSLKATPPLLTLIETLPMSDSHSVSCNRIALHSEMFNLNSAAPVLSVADFIRRFRLTNFECNPAFSSTFGNVLH